MNREKFMRTLKKELDGQLPPEVCAEILSDFEEHFAEATLAGEREEDVCNVLGCPKEIAAQCIENSSWQPKPRILVMPDPIPVPGPEGGITELSVDLLDKNVVCTPCSGSSFRVEIIKNGHIVEDENIKVYQDGSKLIVYQERERHFWLSMLFRAWESKSVHIYVPEDFNGNVAVKIAGGNFSLESLRKLRHVEAELKAGNITIGDVAVRKGISAHTMAGNVKCWAASCEIEAESFSGNVKLEGCAGAAVLKTTAGNVKVDDHQGFVQASSMSGNVKIETDAIDRDCECKTKSGNVKISVQRLAATLHAESLSGNVSIEIEDLDGDIHGKTLSGNVSAKLSHDAKAVFELSAPGKTKHVNMGQGLPSVRLSTTSGWTKVIGVQGV